MWDPAQQSFQTIYKDWDGVDKFSVSNTIQNLFPLLLQDLPRGRVAAIVAQLKDPKK